MKQKKKKRSPFCVQCPLYLMRLEAPKAAVADKARYKRNCEWLRDENECLR